MIHPAHYIMLGGFLGAGKTTTAARLAEWLHARGLRTGIITNDQGSRLVDSALGRARHFDVAEISGGCFCCRFHSLIDAARHLSENTRPDVLLAEPVGSCTDLVATVTLPLQAIYGDAFRVAPLSVLVDPLRARRLLDLDPSRTFSPNVRYIYLKQLEEAEAIIINKTDLVSPAALAELDAALQTRFPDARRFHVQARNNIGLEPWFEWLVTSESSPLHNLDIDYQRYGQGEALLGWLNTACSLQHDDEFDGNQFLRTYARALSQAARQLAIPIAHAKMLLHPSGDPMEVATINFVREESDGEMAHALADPLDSAELLLNLRAEADPALLDQLTRDALASTLTTFPGLAARETHREHFRPAQPVPVHRLSTP